MRMISLWHESIAVLVFALSTWTIAKTAAKTTTFPQFQRCINEFEHFYDENSLRHPFDDGKYLLGHRGYGINEKGYYYINDDGYYVIDGVKVLRKDDPACTGTDRIGTGTNVFRIIATQYNVNGLSTRDFDQGYPLLTEKEDSVDVATMVPQQRSLFVMMAYGVRTEGKRKVGVTGRDGKGIMISKGGRMWKSSHNGNDGCGKGMKKVSI
jgi:hypothetical protein